MIKINFLTGWAPIPSPQGSPSLLRFFKDDLSQLETVIKSIAHFIDSKDYFYSMFQAMHSGVSPFMATHDYCLKVKGYDEENTAETNISPIYHLGLEYPDNYRAKYGKNLDETAVIGLLENPTAGTPLPGHTHYSYGVDAGVLFKDSNIPHNKILTFNLQKIPEGLLVSLSCDTHTSSFTLSWKQLKIDRPE